MKIAIIAESLWGNKAKFRYLLGAAILLIFSFLGGRDLWTQEHRWAEIVFGMQFRHDYLHPWLGQVMYYDKPLLSYWLIAICATLTNALDMVSLRLPSALAGLLAIWSIYRLGTQLKSRQLGLLAGWLLLTSYYFVFWSRISSADMLNMAGSLFAITWYVEKRDHARFFDFAVFFMIVGLTCLCKGLVGAIIPFIAVFIDVLLRNSWRDYLRWQVFVAMIPALLIYLLPFMLSSWIDGDSFGQNGLYLVYRENILRYFQPFDHRGPIYTYFIFLPLYLLPSAILFIPAVFSLRTRWKAMSLSMKWVTWVLFALFVFFSLSGSRRNYYVLPIVPFAVLLTADWLLSGGPRKQWWTAVLVVFSFVFLYLALDVMPAWYYQRYGMHRFATALQHEAGKTKPWKDWKVIVVDADTKLNFYLQLPPTTMRYEGGDLPSFNQQAPDTIYLARKSMAAVLQKELVNYRMFQLPAEYTFPGLKKTISDIPVAFIPNMNNSLLLPEKIIR